MADTVVRQLNGSTTILYPTVYPETKSSKMGYYSFIQPEECPTTGPTAAASSTLLANGTRIDWDSWTCGSQSTLMRGYVPADPHTNQETILSSVESCGTLQVPDSNETMCITILYATSTSGNIALFDCNANASGTACSECIACEVDGYEINLGARFTCPGVSTPTCIALFDQPGAPTSAPTRMPTPTTTATSTTTSTGSSGGQASVIVTGWVAVFAVGAVVASALA